MKKFYNDPTMSVSMFDVENIVTVSGDQPAKTAEQQAIDELTSAGVATGNVATIDITEY